MSDLVRIVLVTLVCVALSWGLIALFRRARMGSRTMKAAGMAMMLFGWGNMRDPRDDTVAEAQDGRIRKDNESGAPPD
jgi:hypothetical protein